MGIKVIVVIPIYRNNLNVYEKISLNQMLKVLNKQEICFIAPESMTIDLSIKVKRVERFPDRFFISTKTYNELLMSDMFYARFCEYEYMLISQLDVFVFEDKTDYFCELGYDYIGAPWLAGYTNYEILNRKVLRVGNGGFSLRKIASCRNAISRNLELAEYYIGKNEDVFFSACDEKGLKVAPVEVALSFAFEREVRRSFELNNHMLPFGCHAWEKYDVEFWIPYIASFGYDVSSIDVKSGAHDLRCLEEYNWLYRCAVFFEQDTFFYSLVERVKKMLCLGDNDNLYLWGAGFWGRNLKRILEDLKMNIDGYIDNKQEIQGNYVDNAMVFSPDRIKETDKIIVSADRKYYKEISMQLESLGKKYSYDYIFWEDLLPKGEYE